MKVSKVVLLVSVLVALVFSFSTACVIVASDDDDHHGNYNSNHNGNSNNNGNFNGNSNDNHNGNSNSNGNNNSNDNSNGNHNGNEVKLYGTVSSIDNNNTSFTIGTGSNQSFTILANTAQIKAEHVPCAYWLTFNDLQVGHSVKTEGWWINGALQAYQVEVYNYTCFPTTTTTIPGATTTTTMPFTTTTIPSIRPGTVIIKGNITAIISDPRNMETGQLVVNGTQVNVTSSTKFKGTVGSFSGLSVGQKVTIKGKPQTNGIIKARTIKTM